MNAVKALIVLALTAVLAALGVQTALAEPVPATAQAACAKMNWGSAPKSNAAMGTGEVDNLRAGRHPCFDRFVIEVDGPIAGFDVRYVDQITQDGSGFVVPTKGAGKRLQVIVRHPSFSPKPVPNVAGFTTFRQIVDAGSFEGQTTYGIGLRNGPLPMRVLILQGAHGRLVVDVAHTW
jgi:hypothetical protein